mgnify:FL=1|tara:strand:+ start:129 stop:713 length:585 start_codon:yes stop_codon:yes gene_type:complete
MRVEQQHLWTPRVPKPSPTPKLLPVMTSERHGAQASAFWQFIASGVAKVKGALNMNGTIYHKDRRLEWSLAAGTFGFGIWLADGSRSMDSDAYIVLRSWLYESDWALLFLITGALHMVALGINGRAWWTPFVRSTVTAVNALVYASFATGFWLMDASSTAVFMYSWASTQALVCIYGAVKDVSRVWRAWLNERQ